MEKDVVKSVFSPAMKDPSYLHEIAVVKRFLEYWTMEPGFQERFLASPKSVVSQYGIDVDVDALKILAVAAEAERVKDWPVENLPRPVQRYRAFIREKIAMRTQLAERGCAPEQKVFRAWRGRQLNRCWVELGLRNQSIIHAPLTFELDLGCSVGCPFCGVAAQGLKRVFRYTPENGTLWQSVLKTTKALIGPAAGTGTCYYATEPFDNPDYEKFADDYFTVFGTVPQITTAAATRKTERTRRYLAAALQKERRIHRFSILSLDIFHAVMREFTPEELVYIELLPQFPEAPSCRFSNVGRARQMKKSGGDADGSTIACISGFIVNMAERTIRLLTPCGSSAKHPTGEIKIARETFTDSSDFRRVLQEMIDQYMAFDFSKKAMLRIRENVKFEKEPTGIAFYCKSGFKLRFKKNDDLPAVHYHKVLDLVGEGEHSAYDIAGKLYDSYGLAPASTFFILQKFAAAGLFYEPYEL